MDITIVMEGGKVVGALAVDAATGEVFPTGTIADVVWRSRFNLPPELTVTIRRNGIRPGENISINIMEAGSE